jgi:hypothetical protein
VVGHSSGIHKALGSTLTTGEREEKQNKTKDKVSFLGKENEKAIDHGEDNST